MLPVGEEAVGGHFETQSPRELGDRLADSSFEHSVKVEFGETGSPCDLLQGQVTIQIPADEVHRSAHASPVLICRMLSYACAASVLHTKAHLRLLMSFLQ